MYIEYKEGEIGVPIKGGNNVTYTPVYFRDLPPFSRFFIYPLEPSYHCAPFIKIDGAFTEANMPYNSLLEQYPNGPFHPIWIYSDQVVFVVEWAEWNNRKQEIIQQNLMSKNDS